MARFAYVVKDVVGRTIKAKEFAVSEHELKTRLGRKNYIIISIKELREPGAVLFTKARVSISDLCLFCKQLATMIKGGVPIMRAIESIADEVKNPAFQGVLREINYFIKGGESVSSSLRRFPNMFSTLFVAMVAAGERVGSLDIMLERLSAYMQARDRLNRKIITALIYPMFILCFFCVAMTVVTFVLIPRFKSIYDGFRAKLPPLTLAIFNISTFALKNAPFVVLAVVGSAIAFYQYFFRSKKGRYAFDALSLKIPFFGAFILNAGVSKFSRTLTTLLNQGISISESLELVGATAGNAILEEATGKVRKLILDGENIPDAMKKAEIFPSLMIQMVSVGVESGNLPELLDKTADFYEERVDAFVTALTTMIEPVLLAVLGVILGIVIVALYLPIFKMTQAMGGN